MPDQQEGSRSNLWTRLAAQEEIYIASLVFCGANLAFYLGWLSVDAPSRFLDVSESWLGNDWRAYLSGRVVFDGWLLYVECLMSAAALVGVFMRRRWALLVLGVTLLSGTLHWTTGATNPHFGSGMAENYAFVHAAVFLITLTLVAMNLSWGGFGEDDS